MTTRTRTPITSAALALALVATACGGAMPGDDAPSSGVEQPANPGDAPAPDPVVDPDPGPNPDPQPDPVVEPEPAPCDVVHIVDLSQDERSTHSCVRAGAAPDVADCVARSVRAALPPNCRSAFDVFVPGTAAEHGAWKQFNAMFSRDTGRGYLSLQYQDAEHIGSSDFDALAYDQGVIDARASLTHLLHALKTRFPDADVSVFGHSKGSHAVSLVADDPAFSDVQFFAFAQPGRTSVDISARGDIRAGRRGTPGYIEKLSPNLVGITWQNDEVKFYTGDGYNGLLMPEKWGFPGYIWQDTVGGTATSKMRIDHHNNYGGRYTDGVANNRWQAGEGATDAAYPYCATGHKSALSDRSECTKQTVDYVPYFWGDAGCRDRAFEMMTASPVGEQHYIGYSGPRAAGCRDDVGTVRASYEMTYRINMADTKDCRYDLQVHFQALNGRDQPYSRPAGGSIRLSSTDDTGWRTARGTVDLPYHTRVRLNASMSELPGWGDCGHLTAASESYVRSLKVTFDHPVTGARTTRTLIGLGEGKDYPWPLKLDRKNNVAWWKWDDPNDRRDTWDLFYAPAPFSALMIKGDTDEDRRGWFYKWVHVLD